MKVAILTWGSRGDYQPYVSLAAAFQSAGHQVRLGTQPLPGFSELAAAHQVELVSLADDFSNEYQRVANIAIATQSDPVKAVRLFLDELFLPAFDQMYELCVSMARWSDVVVSHFLQIGGRMAAEATGRPFVSGTLVPTQIPSDSQPPGTFPNLGRWLNRGIWKMAAAYMNAAWLSPVNEARRRASLGELKDVARQGFYSKDLNLVAVSPTVFPRPSSWAPQHQMTGYWLLDSGQWAPSPELEDFISDGVPPVAVGFGSMLSRDSAGLTAIILEALDRANVRAVIEPGMGGLGEVQLPPNVMLAKDVRHSWLLSRVSALVHHGGVGTSAAVFRAGIPGVFVPHAFDQYEWAKLAHKMGTAPRPIALAKLSAERLATALESAVFDDRLRENAQRLGEKLRQEDGTAVAVRLIEEYVRTGKLASAADVL